jgi:hypothetical protein
MSSTFSAASADSALASNEQECEPSRSVKSSLTPDVSSQSIGQMSPVTTTCEPSPPIAFEQMELLPKSFAAGFRVKTSATQEMARASQEKEAGYGLNTRASFAKFDRASSSWKTSQHCLIEGWETFSQPWPRSGTMRNGIVFQHPTLVPAYPCEIERQRGSKKPLLRQSHLSGKFPRVAENWPGRSNLPAPLLCGASDGIPNFMDRLKGLGNAVVPQIPEIIGRAIMTAALSASTSPQEQQP